MGSRGDDALVEIGIQNCCVTKLTTIHKYTSSQRDSVNASQLHEAKPVIRRIGPTLILELIVCS